MRLTHLFPFTAATLLALTSGAFAADITVEDAFARASTPTAASGAAFMQITNAGAEADRLLSVSSDVAQRVELHTHVMAANGVMRMIEVEDGFEVGPDSTIGLERGGDHIMFLGLTRGLAQGDTVTVTLTFERAGDIEVEIPVDLTR